MAAIGNFLVTSLLTLFFAGEPISIPSLELDSDAVVNAHRAHIHNTVMPWYYGASTAWTFAGVDDVPIFYRSFLVPETRTNHQAIVFLHGAGGKMDKYAEFLYDLRRLTNKHDFYFLEHRGHGSSGRLLDDPRLMHVDSFGNYATDLKTFYDDVVTGGHRIYDRVFLWGHSMGGAVAVQYAQAYPDDIDGLMLSAPMMEITNKQPVRLGEENAYRLACTSTLLLGQGEAVAIGQAVPPDPLVDPDSQEMFEQQTITTSWKRWKVWNEYLQTKPRLIAGGEGATWGYTNQAGQQLYRATFSVREASLTVPVLVFEAGRDFIVGSQGIETFRNNTSRSASYFETVTLPDAYHEVFFEQDSIRAKVLSSTAEFLARFF